MSHQTHESDRSAAYRGLILGAIVLGIVLVTVVRLTHAHYAGAEGGKTASHASANNAAGPLDA
ncbi:MAG: hypothetical protein ACHQSE_04785 [Gemmatimonadales bacterium]